MNILSKISFEAPNRKRVEAIKGLGNRLKFIWKTVLGNEENELAKKNDEKEWKVN